MVSRASRAALAGNYARADFNRLFFASVVELLKCHVRQANSAKLIDLSGMGNARIRRTHLSMRLQVLAPVRLAVASPFLLAFVFASKSGAGFSLDLVPELLEQLGIRCSKIKLVNISFVKGERHAEQDVPAFHSGVAQAAGGEGRSGRVHRSLGDCISGVHR